MGLLTGFKERALSGKIYALYAAKRSAYPDASEFDLLAETCRHHLDNLRKKYPDLEELSLDDVRGILAEDNIRDIDSLVAFIIGFERRAAELHS